MSTVSVTIASVDLTNHCVFERCSFTSQMNGVAGTFEVYLRDYDRTLSFTTGAEVVLSIDSVAVFGGYVTAVGMTSFAPAADTSGDYHLRLWHLTGVDYNILFDRRVARDTANYLKAPIEFPSALTHDGDVLKSLVNDYADMAGFSTSGIANVAPLGMPTGWKYPVAPGSYLRTTFESLLKRAAATYFIDAGKVVNWVPYDAVTKSWGFSDAPDHSTRFGFSSVEGVQDGMQMANDVLIWGGSNIAGATGGVVFARYQDAVPSLATGPNSYVEYGAPVGGSSIDLHGRWQHAEVNVSQTGNLTLDGVKAVAQAVLNGPPGTDATGAEKGLRNPQWSFTFDWNSSQVPAGDPVRAGDIVPVDLTAFGVSQLAPVRSVTISFPDALEDPATAEHLVHFRGTFGLQLSDSFLLWRYIIQGNARNAAAEPVVRAVTQASTHTMMGASFLGIPTPGTGNGSTTVFTIPFGYVPGTLQVFVDGKLKTPGTDYTESDYTTGEFTMAVAPASGLAMMAAATTLAA